MSRSQNFKLIISRDATSEILLSHNDGNFTLPQITIPARQRISQCITERVLNAWNLRTVCLFQPDDQNSLQTGEDQYMVLESRDPAWSPPANFSWISREQTALHSATQNDFLQKALKFADAYNQGELPGPFARAGWIDDLLSWAQEHADRQGLRITGKFSQLNCSPFFSLIKLETTGPALWFKAVGEPSRHEYSITLGLAQEHRRYIPPIIAAQPEWNGWLMLEVGGQSFDQSQEITQLESVAETLACLQLECLRKDNWLLGIGCKDRRIDMLVQRIDDFLEAMLILMDEQPAEPPQRLSRSQLKKLGSNLRDACYRMHASGIPDSLLHGDFSPNNVRISRENCVFLDWSEGYLGPPFLTLEYLIAHLHKIDLGFAEWERRIRHAYAKRWTTVASNRQIAKAMAVASPVAMFCYALAAPAWREPKLLKEYGLAKNLRSITRRMYRELDISDREFCLM